MVFYIVPDVISFHSVSRITPMQILKNNHVLEMATFGILI